MKQIRIQSILGVLSIGAIIVILNALSSHLETDASERESRFKGPYLGQTPPGSIPQTFAPEFFVEEVHSCPVFSCDMTEMYWDLMGNEGHTLYTRREEGGWTEPRKVPFDSKYGTYDPCFSPDGRKLFYASSEKITGGKKDKKKNLWCVERIEDNWADPTSLPSAVNSRDIHWQISVAESGNLYFGSDQDIVCARVIDGQYSEVTRLGDAINSDLYEGTPFVAPDESYILFSRHGGEIGLADLFVSFKDSAGHWTPAMSMGDQINSPGNDLCPQVSPDGKYLFFIRNDHNGELKPFWVEAGMIEDLRTQCLNR